MNKLTLQSKKDYKNFGLAFGLSFLLVQVFPIINGLFKNVYPSNLTPIGMFITSLLSSPAIFFLAIGFSKSYKEKMIFWIGIMAIWLNVMLNLYIHHGGEVIYLQNIFHTLSRKLVAAIITLLIIRNFITSQKIAHLFIGFGLFITLPIVSSFLQANEQISTNEIISQSLWGVLFYVLGLFIGYILFNIFSGQNDHEDTKAEVLAPAYNKSQLVFYFMIFCLYFSDYWIGSSTMRTEANILFQLLFASIGIIYFSKNIISIGMALTLISLIGRIIAFSKDMSAMNSLGIGVTLLFLVLFELSRRSKLGVKS